MNKRKSNILKLKINKKNMLQTFPVPVKIFTPEQCEQLYGKNIVNEFVEETNTIRFIPIGEDNE